MPFSVSGVQPDAIVNLAGVQVSMDAANGSHWNSGWKMFARDIFPEQTATEIDFSMKRDEFVRMQSSPRSTCGLPSPTPCFATETNGNS